MAVEVRCASKGDFRGPFFFFGKPFLASFGILQY